MVTLQGADSVGTLLGNNIPGNYLSGVITPDSTDHLPTFLRLPLETFRTDDSKIKVSFRCLKNQSIM